MLTNITLGGWLGRELGRQWRMDLDTPSPAEAVRALCAVCTEFRQKLIEHHRPGFHVFIRGESIGAKQLAEPTGSARIVIVPALAGAGGDDPKHQVILGGVMILGGLFLEFIPGAQGIGTALILNGVVMEVHGISALLASRPEIAKPPDKQQTPNYVFSGPVNTVGVGRPVPIVYGRLEIGSQVVSAHITQHAPAVNTATEPMDPPGTGLPGGWHNPQWQSDEDLP